MSIAKMISLHPDVEGHLNEPLAQAVRHLMFCSSMCASCADACAAEKMDMRQCIRLCLDCSDICGAAARVGLRRTGSNEAVLRSILDLATASAEICAEECERHDHAHCKLNAEMCREVAQDCRNVTL